MNQTLNPSRSAHDLLIRPLVYVENGCVLFSENPAYEIELNWINTPEKALAWIAILAQKRWVTLRTIETLISVLEEAGVSVQR